MQNQPIALETDLDGLEFEEWLDRIEDLADDLGFFEPLGPDHQATFVEGGDRLLVTFEDAQTIQRQGDGEPMGFRFVRADGWSHLAVISNAESWFRHPAIYSFFDRLIDDGFFDEFEEVLFYGAGSAGYAAAAYSVSAPGARVVAIRPQATLDPSVAFWDTRYVKQRRLNFTDRYGYAPDMIDAAAQAYVVYSPISKPDAIHAALFTRQNVTKLRAQGLGGRLEDHLAGLDVLDPMLRAAMSGDLSVPDFAQMMAPAKGYANYQRGLFKRALESGHDTLAANVAAYVLRQGEDAFFAKRLGELAERGVHPARPVASAAE